MEPPTGNQTPSTGESQAGRGQGGGRNKVRGGDRRSQGGRGGNSYRGGRSDHGGRGARGGQRGGAPTPEARQAPTNEALGPRGVDGQRATSTQDMSVPTSGPTATGEAGEDEDVEAEVCFICASPVVHNSVAPCNHRTCHICALRLRALYKTKACAHCRTNADYVIFTDDAVKRFEDFTMADFSSQDPSLGINYEKQVIFEDTVLLLRYNCPDPGCDVACLGWPDLHRHVKTVHHKVMCDLCTRNKKVFTHEHELFTPQELRKHEKFGDDHPGAVDQSGFKGHPECGFCKQRFYGDDELFAHCRDKHERCHVCDRRDGGRQPQYYLDYNALEQHFRKDHFPCQDQECLEKKFVVFGSEMDLKVHQLEAHPNGLTKAARRDARTVDISGFDYRSPHQQERERPRREGRGRGRGRDPNAEPLPPSSAQPMRRDELAYQRQMAIHSAQSVTARSFGGQLTQSDTPAARSQQNAAEPQTITARPSHPEAISLDPLSLDSTPTANLSPQEQAKRLRHGAVVERASNLLQNDNAKVSEFRTKVSSYRSGTMTAQQLIDSFFTLFDTSSAELGKLLKELADIFEVPKKRDDLLKAWSDWKAINEDYPTLSGPGAPLVSKPNGSASWANLGGAQASGPSSATPSSGGGSRVLKLKSSTQRSSLTASRNVAASAQGNPFPPLSTVMTSRQPQRSSVPAWLSAATNTASGPAVSSKILTTSASSSARASPAPMPRQQPPGARVGKDMFPALPAAAKPTSSVFSPGYNGAGVKRVNSPAVAGAWGASNGGGAVQPANTGTPSAEQAAESGGGGKKQGKGKKMVLYNWG